tara:strand:- start:220 stop:945 length:726 start_codon:yes stop_codon:yes gene_type:complete
MATLTTPPTSPTPTSVNSPTTTSIGPDTTGAIFPAQPIEKVLYNPASKDQAIMVTLMNLIINEKLPFIRLATPNAILVVKREDGKNKWRIRQVAGPKGAIELCLDADKRNDFDNQSNPIILRVKEIYLKACDNIKTSNDELQKYLFREFKEIREENSAIGGAIDGAIGAAMVFGYDDEEMTLVQQIDFYAKHINSLIRQADENQLTELARTNSVKELTEKMEKMKTHEGGEKKTDPYQLRF